MSLPSPAQPRTFVFAGGGTGGHIFPALAIAEQILARNPEAECLFLCSRRPLDAQILGEHRLAGGPIHFTPIDANPVSLRPAGLYRFITHWGVGLRTCRRILRDLKASERAVTLVAMGGFVAAPAAQAARVERVPVLLVNLDAVPGRANRWIAGRAQHIVTAMSLAPQYAKGRENWRVVPPIVRDAARVVMTPQEARSKLGLNPELPVLLVTGASQGATSLNDLMRHMVETDRGSLGQWQVLHQTGKKADAPVREAYRAAGIPAVVVEFTPEIGLFWRAADVAVSRAGAGSVAEAWANGVPTLFLPYPYHRDQHQKYNAARLVEAGAALLATDLVDPELNLRSAGQLIGRLLKDTSERAAMREAFARLGPADGSAQIAGILLET